jgi:hypothetical protein
MPLCTRQVEKFRDVTSASRFTKGWDGKDEEGVDGIKKGGKMGKQELREKSRSAYGSMLQLLKMDRAQAWNPLDIWITFKKL